MHPVVAVFQWWSVPAPVVQSILKIHPFERATHIKLGRVGERRYVMIRVEEGGGSSSTFKFNFMDRLRREFEVE
jgi:hypothetical protein